VIVFLKTCTVGLLTNRSPLCQGQIEPVIPVPDFRYLTDSITRAYEISPGATQWISDPIKDSNPFGIVIDISSER